MEREAGTRSEVTAGLPPSTIRGQSWAAETARTVLPSVLAVGLFVLAIFGVLLPAFKDSVLERKKDMLRELTRTAHAVLAFQEAKVRQGRKTERQAQQEAIAQLRRLRYGPEGKDYFWVNDLHPRMVMHPYRPDLDGQSMREFRDPRGTLLFVEMVKRVKQGGEGFTPYLWQWKDDPHRVVPKLSHVRLFAPWQWVVGTGVYLDDVRAEVSALVRSVLGVSLGILTLIGLLSFYIVRNSLRGTAERREAELRLAAYRDSLEDLVEERTVALALANGRLTEQVSALEAAERLKEKLISDLQAAASEVKTLSGLLPICASCKKIRDERGHWSPVEVYIEHKSDAEFTHGICPGCAKRLYGVDDTPRVSR
ncbi:MAG: cache domain-containing protein [Proteobacteria bacterium]|nr:cache domain-containing protein [Pseudomonadota bacterium]